MRTLRHRLGLVPKSRERSLWLIGDSADSFEGVAPLLAATSDRFPRLNIYLSAPAQLQLLLATRFPTARVHDLPFANPASVAGFLARGNFRTVAVLDDVAALPPTLIAGIRRAGVSLLHLAARNRPPSPQIAEAAEFLVHFSDSSTPPVATGNSKERVLDLSETVLLIGELLGRDLKAKREGARFGGSIAGGLLAATRHGPWREALKWRIARYGDAADLRARLKTPKAILCLGNGPSSEDRSLSAMPHDALFRVNHSWLSRGFLCAPDVVFTGGTRSMTAVADAIFGVQSGEAERRIIAARAFDPRLPATEFFNVGDISERLWSFPWGTLRPTNGAAMIAAAVALKPQRLIVGGIDLFQHPDGSYPGDRSTPNAFSPAHDRDAELSFILGLLNDFQGEIHIVGDILKTAYNRSKSGLNP